MILAIAAKRLLKKGCQGYLAHVRDARIPSTDLGDIPGVRDYLDVFPDDLPGLAPDRVSRPDSRPDPNDGSESSSGRETMYWDSLPA